MADIIGKFIERHGEDVLEALLVDQTTRRNIICADSEYSDHGYGFDCMDEIAIPQLTGKYAGLIRTRADKALESQSHRKRDDDEQGDEAGGDAVEASESDEQEHDAPDGASEVELRARVDRCDVAQRDGLRVRAERDQAEQGVRGRVLDAGRACGDAGLEPEDDHAGTETVPDDVLLAWREREFGHGLLCFGHCPFSPCFSVLLVGFCRLTGSLRVRPV